MKDMQRCLLFLGCGLAVVAFAGAASAQLVPGSIGNGGRMPDTMSPGALPPPPVAPPAPVMAPPPPQPNTYSLNRDRLVVADPASNDHLIDDRRDGNDRAALDRRSVGREPV